jgi:hypothetical protein
MKLVCGSGSHGIVVRLRYGSWEVKMKAECNQHKLNFSVSDRVHKTTANIKSEHAEATEPRRVAKRTLDYWSGGRRYRWTRYSEKVERLHAWTQIMVTVASSLIKTRLNANCKSLGPISYLKLSHIKLFVCVSVFHWFSKVKCFLSINLLLLSLCLFRQFHLCSPYEVSSETNLAISVFLPSPRMRVKAYFPCYGLLITPLYTWTKAYGMYKALHTIHKNNYLPVRN